MIELLHVGGTRVAGSQRHVFGGKTAQRIALGGCGELRQHQPGAAAAARAVDAHPARAQRRVDQAVAPDRRTRVVGAQAGHIERARGRPRQPAVELKVGVEDGPQHPWHLGKRAVRALAASKQRLAARHGVLEKRVGFAGARGRPSCWRGGRTAE
eukprot:scaffold1373_cov96-Isochrysis_galbana.AAC.2